MQRSIQVMLSNFKSELSITGCVVENDSTEFLRYQIKYTALSHAGIARLAKGCEKVLQFYHAKYKKFRK